MSPEIEVKLRKLKEQFAKSLEPKQFEVFVRPLANATGIGDNSSNADVLERVEVFLREERIISLLLVGDGGMGKTLTSQYIVRHMWERYQSGEWIPIYIYLASYRSKAASARENDLLETFFKDYDFSKNEIAELKATGKLLVILDGYDELKFDENRPINLYICHRLNEWRNLRLITASREENLLTYSRQENTPYPTWFYPTEGADRFSELHLCPFSMEQRKDYLQQYVRTKRPSITPPTAEPIVPKEKDAVTADTKAPKKEDDWTQWETYEHYLTTLSGLTALVETPVILYMIVEVLPTVIGDCNDENELKQLRITRTKIYKRFVDAYFTRQIIRLNDEGKLTHLSSEQKMRYLWRYAENLASWVWQDGKGRFTEIFIPETETLKPELFALSRMELTQCSPNSASTTNEVRLLPTDYEAIRAGCLLRTHGDCFRFLHKSLIEFFAARELFEGVMTMVEYASVLRKKFTQVTPDKTAEDDKGKGKETAVSLEAEELSTERVAVEVAESEEYKKQKETKELAQTLPFNAYLINEEPSVVRLLAERASENQEFRMGLLGIVGYSRCDEDVQIAAANAMTVLNYAQVCFTEVDLDDRPGNFVGAKIPGADLSRGRPGNFVGVRIPGADLSRGLLAETDFSGAILRGVKFDGAVLTNARFVGADLTGVEFGLEQKFVPTMGIYTMAAFSNDGKYLFAFEFKDPGNKMPRYFISVIEISTGKMIRQEMLVGNPRNPYYDPVLKLRPKLICDANFIVTKVWDKIKIFNHDGRQCVATITCKDGREVPWIVSLEELFENTKIPVNTMQVVSEDLEIAFTPKGYLLIAHAFHGYIIVFDPRDRKITDLVGEYEGKVKKLIGNIDGQLLAMINTSCHCSDTVYSIQIWDIKNQCLKFRVHESKDEITTIAFGMGRSSHLLASGDKNRVIELWDAITGAKIAVFSALAAIRMVIFSPDGSLIIAASNDRLLYSWSIKELTLLSLQTYESEPQDLVFSPDGSLFAVTTYDKIIIKNTLILQGTISLYQPYDLHDEFVDFSPSGKLMAIYKNGKCDVITWQRELKVSFTLPSCTTLGIPFPRHAFLNEQLLAIANDKKQVQIWDIEQPPKLAGIISSSLGLLLRGLGFNPRERQLILISMGCVCAYCMIEVWDVRDFSKICRLKTFIQDTPDRDAFSYRWTIQNNFIVNYGSHFIIHVPTQQSWVFQEVWQSFKRGITEKCTEDGNVVEVRPDAPPMTINDRAELQNLERAVKHVIDGKQCMFVAISANGKLFILQVLSGPKTVVWNLENGTCTQVQTILPFRTVKFINDTTFVAVDFYLGYSEWRVNIYPDGKLFLYPTIRNRCLATEAECSGLNLSYARGDIPDRDLMLLKQHGAVGAPRKAEAMGEKRALLLGTYGIPVRNWIAMRLSADSARPCDNCFSLIDEGITMNYDNWVVSIVRFPDSQYPNHGRLLVEGLDMYGKVILWQAHYVPGKYPGSGSAGPSSVVITSTKGAVLGTYEFDLEPMRESRQQKITDFFHHDLQDGKKINYLSWGITRQQALQLLEEFMHDQFNPPQYFLLSGIAFWRRKPDTNEHNCFTWARAKLVQLKDAAIILPVSPRDIMSQMHEKAWILGAAPACSAAR